MVPLSTRKTLVLIARPIRATLGTGESNLVCQFILKDNVYGKEIYFLLIMCVVCFSILPACAANPGTTEPDVLTYAEMLSVFEHFEPELRYIEESESADRSSLSSEELNKIQKIAVAQVNNGNSRFAELMDAIAVAIEEKKPQARWSSIQNDTSGVYKSFGPIKGTHIGDITAGTEVTESYEVSVEAGFEVDDISIGIGISRSGSTTFIGPTTSDVLPNGISVSHHVMAAVLYGTIMRAEYDLVTATGTTHVKYYYIQSETATTKTYALQAYLGTPTYVKHAGNNIYFRYESFLTFYDELEKNPGKFVTVYP